MTNISPRLWRWAHDQREHPELCAAGYKGIHCAHGFRSSASTMLNRERVDGRRRFERELSEMQQDRLDASTRAVYDRDDRLPERVDLMQFWAD
jgi:hypothetical protein